MKKKQIFLITYHAVPNKKAEGYEDFAGAYVNCYIESTSIYDALKKAEEEIRDTKWGKLDFRYATVANEEELDDTKKEYYEQALIDKEVLVFHTYPQNEE